MKPFTQHQGNAVALLQPNIDTDAIIPSREMTSVGKRGLADGLFAGWRYLPSSDAHLGRTPNPDFALNQVDDVSILIAGPNFGCGSSREHAVWALVEYGIRAIIAPSFGAIFRNNCIRNGVLPISLPQTTVAALAQALSEAEPSIAIDLAQRRLRTASGMQLAFELPDSDHNMLVKGLDAIGLTQQHEADIRAFMQQDAHNRRWAQFRPAAR